jgi:hypothetical protein
LKNGGSRAQLGLTIEPDPSELKLPPTVRRLAACACGSAASGAVCAIECRSGDGPSEPIAGTGDDDFEWGKDTRPASRNPFGDKRAMPSAPKASKPGGK